MSETRRHHLLSVGSVAVLLIAWEAAARAGLAPRLFLPALSTVVQKFAELTAHGSLPVDLATSLYRAGAGVALAAAIGIFLGIAMARARWLAWLLDPVVA